MPQRPLMSHLRPVQPEAFDQFMPPEDEILPFQRVMMAGGRTLRAKTRIHRTVWISMGVPVGFAVAWLPWFAWVALLVVLVAWMVAASVAYNAAKVSQMEIERENERAGGVKIVEPREDEAA